MEELISLVRDTLTLIRPPPKEEQVKAPLARAPAQLSPKIPPAAEKTASAAPVDQVSPPVPEKKAPVEITDFSTMRNAYLAAFSKAKVLETAASDHLAKEKKERWKKQIDQQTALLVFAAPCHPLLFDLEHAIHTRLMSIALISVEELLSLEQTKARLIIYEMTLDHTLQPIKERFPKAHFLEIPLASSLAIDPSLKRQLWKRLQDELR